MKRFIPEPEPYSMNQSAPSDFPAGEEEDLKSLAEDRAHALLDEIRDYVRSGDLEGVLAPVALIALLQWMRARASQNGGEGEVFSSKELDRLRARDFLLEQPQELEPLLESHGIYLEIGDDFRVLPEMSSEIRDRYLQALTGWFDSFNLESRSGWEFLRASYEALIERLIQDSRDAGQFGTPSSIRSLMLDLAAPQKGEQIYDPCFGTGGLLRGVLRRLERPASPNKSTSEGQIGLYGVELNHNLHLIGTARVLLSGARMPQLKCGDALNATPGKEWDLKGDGFDLILANPPIGSFRKRGQQIDREKYPVSARHMENLFVQHALHNLRPGGRAVILVPNGLLFRSSDQDLRRLLTEEYRLLSVVGLPRLSFHTSIPGAVTSIQRREPRNHIWFVSSEASSFSSRAGKRDSKVELVEVEDLPSGAYFDEHGKEGSDDWQKREHIFRFSRERVADRDYILTPKPTGDEDVRQFLDQITALGHDVDVKDFGEVANVFSGRSHGRDDYVEEDVPSSQKGPQYLQVGDIRSGFIESSDIYLGKGVANERERLEEGDILLTSVGTVGRIASVSSKFAGSVPSQGIIVIRPEEELQPAYVHRLLMSSAYQKWIEGHSVGSTIHRLRITELRSLNIPVLSGDLQETVALVTDPGVSSDRILFVLSGEIEEDPIVTYLSESRDVEELDLGRYEVEDKMYEASDTPSQSLVGDMVSRLVSIRKHLLSRHGESANEVAQKWAKTVTSEIRKIELGANLDSPAERLLSLERVGTSNFAELEQNLPDLVSSQASYVTKAIGTLQHALREKAYRQVDFGAAVDPEVIPVGQSTLVTLRLINEGLLAVRDIQANVVGVQESTKKVEALQVGESLQWETTTSFDELGTHQVEIRWKAMRLDGKSIRGKEEVTFDVRKKERTERTESDTDIGENPYIIATPIDSMERPEMFKGREKQIEQIRSSLKTGGTNTVILMEGNRRTGKTSILRRLEHPDVLPEEWIPVYCNFQEGSGDQELAGLKTGEVFYRVARELVLKILERGHKVDVLGSGVLSPDQKRYKVRKSLMREMRPNFADTPNAFESLEVIVESVRYAVGERRLLLMLDEFDKVLEGIDSGLTQQTVPENFRSLFHDHKGVSGIITGSRRIRRLREYKYSALFGIGLHIPIKALDKNAAIDLVTDPVEGQLQYTKEARERIVRECACQPYLIQYLCHTVFQLCKAKETRTVSPEIVDKAAIDLVQDNEHFRHLWDEAGSDRKRYLVCLIDRLSEDERVTYDVLSEILASEGISTIDLDQSLEDLLEKETISRKEVRTGATEYQLEVPLFSRWISANEDASIYKERVLENQEK
jgi:type I restriction enzyme M protein